MKMCEPWQAEKSKAKEMKANLGYSGADKNIQAYKVERLL